MPPAQNQPFARNEVLPLYVANGGRHTLPPVLPLDQSRSAAGFSESAGDSLGLVDLIYRDAAGTEQQVLTTLLGTPQSPSTRTNEKPEPVPSSAPPGVSTADTAVAVEAPPAVPATENYAYAAVAVLATGAGWLSRGYVVALFRSALRLFRPNHRQPTRGAT